MLRGIATDGRKMAKRRVAFASHAHLAVEEFLGALKCLQFCLLILGHKQFDVYSFSFPPGEVFLKVHFNKFVFSFVRFNKIFQHRFI